MFNPWDRRTYTYTYDGDEPIVEGETRAEVETKNGLVPVTIETVRNERPGGIPAHVELKPIVRLLPRDAEGAV
jgi:hypothetical protein